MEASHHKLSRTSLEREIEFSGAMNLSIEKDIDDILNPENDWNQYDSALYGLDHREKQSTKVTNQQELGEEKEEEIEEEREKASLSEKASLILSA